MQNELRNQAKELFAAQKIDFLVGYGLTESGVVGAVFLTKAEDCETLLWNESCTTNLTAYLHRKELKKYGKIGIVAKGCDAKSLAVLEIEKQIDRNNLVVLGVVCMGVLDDAGERGSSDRVLAGKCASCDVHQPPHCDIVIAPKDAATVATAKELDARNAENSGARYEKLEKLMAMSVDERLEFWKKEFDRCFKCYACRQVCPMCYCEVCVADKNRPVRFDTSATPKGNFAWHIVRAFHLGGRCVGCSACSAACPAGIDLDLLNLSLAKATEDHFAFRSGYDRQAVPFMGTFSYEDREDFIR